MACGFLGRLRRSKLFLEVINVYHLGDPFVEPFVQCFFFDDDT